MPLQSRNFPLAGLLANVSLQNLAKLSQLMVNDGISHLTKPDILLTEARKKNLSKPDMCSAKSVQPLGSFAGSFSLWRHASLTQALNWPFPAAVAICSKRSSSNRMFLTVLFERSKLRLVFFSCIGSQPLGSMPWRCNSCRASCLSQLPRLTPSRSAASLSCSLSSGLIRIWNVGDKPSPLGVLSLFAVDMYVRNLIGCFLLRTYINMPSVIVTTPRQCLEPLSGRLTKPLIEVTVMAMNKHTQTCPKYQYRFLAVSRQDRSVPPFRLCIDARSEQEARRLLAPCFILSFAGQLPVQEARNA